MKMSYFLNTYEISVNSAPGKPTVKLLVYFCDHPFTFDVGNGNNIYYLHPVINQLATEFISTKQSNDAFHLI